MTTTRKPAVMMAGMSSATGVLRQKHGDPSYLEAFARILDHAREEGR
jgi:hypothetical protein